METTAARRFFEIPELVDLLLPQLHQVQICQLRRVSPLCNARVLAANKQLRQYLFLEAKPMTEGLIPINGEDQKLVRITDLKSGEKYRKIARVHPILAPGLRLPTGTIKAFPRKGLSRQEILSWRKGPWLKMFVTQPPCKEISLEALHKRGPDAPPRERANELDIRGCDHVLNDTGVTFGDLRKLLKRRRDFSHADIVRLTVGGWVEKRSPAVRKARTGRRRPREVFDERLLTFNIVVDLMKHWDQTFKEAEFPQEWLDAWDEEERAGN